MTDIKLTENEAAVLKNLAKFEYMDDGIDTLAVWAFSFAEDVARYCSVPASSTGGIVASLATKGFVTVDNGIGDDKAVWLTDLAREYHAKLNS